MVDYRFETFPAAVDANGHADSRTREFDEALRQGFFDPRYSDAQMDAAARRLVDDGRILTGAYIEESPRGGLSPDRPVATFVTFPKRMNIGYRRQVEAHLITGVTVRPTHRRRGLLRRLMETDLRKAAEAGSSIAALTATEGTIYRRFGFGPAEWQSRIVLDTRAGLGFLSPADGRIELAEPKELLALAPEIYARFQARTPGALERTQLYWEVAAGEVNPESREKDLAVRAAIHYDADGAPDGYVAYKHTGWKDVSGIRILDLIAVSDDAYRSLWQFLGTLDLVERVTFDAAAADSPLPWMLVDRRRADVKSREDGIWLRLLDVPTALRERGWTPEVSGSLRLRVHDPLGITGGDLHLEVAGGEATVEPVSGGEPDLELDVADLSSLYLGGADPVVLARAGRLAEHRGGAAARLRALLALERAPHAPSHF